jgi:hypothetical protein
MITNRKRFLRYITGGLLILAGLSSLLWGMMFASVSAAGSPDINGDGQVNITDLSMLLSKFGTSDPTADVNGDGQVDIVDLSALLSKFGTSVSPTSPDFEVVNDAAASGGKALSLNTNATASKLTTTPAVTNVTVTARGEQCEGNPSMELKIDGSLVTTASVASSTYNTYQGARTLTPGSHRVDISFTNGHSTSSCTRRLILDKVEFTPASETNPEPTNFTNASNFAAGQLAQTATSLAPNRYPINTRTSGAWQTGSASDWTSGFFPGSLWYEYKRTNDPIWKTRAEQWTAGLEAQKNNTSTHDIGFIIFSSYGNGYKFTGNEAYKQVVLTAAASLATRYNPTVGSFRSWDNPDDFQVIIDNMMNLEMMFWASKNGGQQAWYDMAVSHALKARQNHVRPDGSTYQLVNYDENTGAVKSRVTRQGASDNSTWARGQAWAIYGFTTAYRETNDVLFLQTARATADYYIAHLPGDKIPYWDFQAPNIPNEPKDSSAASAAASGLLELARLETDAARASRYRTAAIDTLTSLASSSYLAQGTNNRAVLLHGTYNKPAGIYDTGLSWGDYYFLEALDRYSQKS